MKDASMSLGIYLEIKDAEICGGDGSIGWAATIVDIYSSDRPGIISISGKDILKDRELMDGAEFQELEPVANK